MPMPLVPLKYFKFAIAVIIYCNYHRRPCYSILMIFHGKNVKNVNEFIRSSRESIEKIQRELNRNQENPILYYKLGSLYKDIGQEGRAISQYETGSHYQRYVKQEVAWAASHAETGWVSSDPVSHPISLDTSSCTSTLVPASADGIHVPTNGRQMLALSR